MSYKQNLLCTECLYQADFHGNDHFWAEGNHGPKNKTQETLSHKPRE